MKRKLKSQMIISGKLKQLFKVTEPVDVVPKGTVVTLQSVNLNPAYQSGCEARIQLTHNRLTRVISVDPGILTT